MERDFDLQEYLLTLDKTQSSLVDCLEVFENLETETLHECLENDFSLILESTN